MATTAAGERAVSVGGDVRDSLIVTGDNVRIGVGPGGVGGTLLYLLGWRRKVRKRARPTPLNVGPGAFDGIDRERESAALARSGSPVSVTGVALVGKTQVVRAAFGRHDAVGRDGILYVRGRGCNLDDLLQAVWEEFYDCKPPAKATARELREDLARREALVVIDDLELEHRDAQALAAALPACRLVLVSRERQFWDGHELPVPGLATPDGVALLERELGSRLVGDEREAAGQVVAALAGHPQQIRQAAGLVRNGTHTFPQVARMLTASAPAEKLARAATAGLSERSREVLAALAPFGDAPLAAGRVEELAGPGAAQVASELVERGLAVSHSPSYSAAVHASRLDPAGPLERALERAADYVARLAESDPQGVEGDLPAALSLFRRLIADTRWREAIVLGRALVPALIFARRFGAWQEIAAGVGNAARQVGDAAAEAWALHEQGTRALARQDPGGRELLRQALERREKIGDEAGVLASRHNLSLPAGPPWYLRSFAHLPVIGIVAAITVLLSATGVALADWIGRDDGSPNAPTTEPVAPTTDGTTTEAARITVTVEIEGQGTVEESSGRLSCEEGCERQVAAGTHLTFRAEPDDGWRFARWSGACSGQDECRLTPARDLALAARFVKLSPRERTLRIEIVGSGAVTAGSADPCTRSCERVFPVGASVDLSHHAADGWQFSGWSDDCSGEHCSLTLDRDATVTGSFVRKSKPGAHSLTVDLAEGGTVTSEPAGIDCPGDCSEPFEDDLVTLRAAPNEGWRLADWDYDECSTEDDECRVRLDGDLTIKPVFERLATLEITEAEGGSVSFDVGGETVTCPDVCSATFPAGSQVVLTAEPDEGFGPVDWSIPGCGTGERCHLAVRRTTVVTPRFPKETTLALTIRGKYGGRVKLADPPYDCEVRPKVSQPCTPTVYVGHVGVLTAQDTTVAEFVRWDGDAASCGTAASCRVLFGGAPQVTAIFSPKPTLTVTVVGAPGDRVVSAPDGIDCEIPKGSDTRQCRSPFRRNSEIVLTATRPGLNRALEWSPPLCTRSVECRVTLKGSTEVRVEYVQWPG